MSEMAGKEVCTSYVADGDEFIAQVILDGAARPEMSQRAVLGTS